MFAATDEDEDEIEGFFNLYVNGHWIWDDEKGTLDFVSDEPPEKEETHQIPTKVPTGMIEFRDDVDMIEQLYYRRRYLRKLMPGQPEIITLQDVKDIAIYTAPVNILSPMLINMLHIPTTERFIRALILFCGYYLQVGDEITERNLELATRIRTPDCEMLENEYRDDLSDLRFLVAKEYSMMLVGAGDTKKFHHMGPNKKRNSLKDKDARLFETLIRLSVQIIWLALGRKSINQIELEVNRLFKSEIFNMAEHTLKTDYVAKMTKDERNVLIGNRVRYEKKLRMHSPLMNEIWCRRESDYSMSGLGVVKPARMSPRLQYLKLVVAGPEESLLENEISLGIIGMSRSAFDIMLKPHPQAVGASSTEGRFRSVSSVSAGSKNLKSKISMKKAGSVLQKLYPNIVLPRRESKEMFPSSFPYESERIQICSNTQRLRWLARLQKLRSR